MEHATDNSATAAAKALTVRALLVAALLAVVVVVLVEHHDGNVAGRNVVSQNHVAPVVMGVVLFFVFVNAAVRRFSRTLGLAGGELAVVLTLLVLSAPAIRYYAHNWVGTAGHTPALIATEAVRDLQKVNPYVVLPPGAMLSRDDSMAFLATVTDEPGKLPGGMARVSKVPWAKWLGPLSFFAPAMMLFLVVSVCLAMVYYRQWAHRELAPFPIAQFGAMLVESRQNRVLPDIFYNRLFWCGVGLMVFIFGVNGLHAHYENMIQVPTKIAYYDLAKSFPFMDKSREGYSLLRGTFFFTMIAIAVLLPSEISFTSWFTWPIMVIATFFYYQRTGQVLNGRDNGIMLTGGHVAMTLLILYAGRTFYTALLRRSIGLQTREDVDRQSLVALRVLAIATLLLGGWMMRREVPLDIVVICLVLGFIHLTVMCRLVAEMGIIWMPLADQLPLSVMLVVAGVKTIGVKAYAMLAILQSHLMPTHVSTLPIAPAVMNGARIEARVTGRSTVMATAMPALVVVLLLSAATLIWLGYSVEGGAEDVFLSGGGGREVTQAAKRIYAVADSGNAAQLLAAEPAGFATRWSLAQRPAGFAAFFIFGFALVMATGVARLKFPRFPLHPLPMLLLGTWLMSRYVFSFFVGWLIKKALIKIGGGKLFEQSRPFFAGIVVGQAAIATVWVVVNIAIFHQQDQQFMDTWYRFMMDIYSS